jgi:hypothetical protein
MSRQWAGRKLRIAQVAPLFVRVPPERYGGACRSWALHRFSHVQMADGYESAYQRIVGAGSSQVSVFPNTLSTNL